MTSGTGRRPFSTLGDQQLLDQARRLAANQRSLEVHILDHLDEIDRRNLALRRGFSSLFEYAVRELRFTDASAQRRIQTMRLCRRHGWVRAKLHNGDLSLTSAAQLETAFAAAERQCRRESPNVGQERCHDLLGPPASPSAAGTRDADESGAEAGEASAAAMTGAATQAVAAVDKEARSPRDAGGHEDSRTGSDRCRRPSDEPVAGSPGDDGAHEEPHTGSNRCRRLSDVSPAVDAGPAATVSQPVGRSQSSADISRAAAASTPVGGLRRPDLSAASLSPPSQAAPGRVPRAGLVGEVAADQPVVPGANHAAAQHRGAGHAHALPARLTSNGAASHSPGSARAPGSATPSSDQGPAAPVLPPESCEAPVPLPVVAQSVPRPTAPLAPGPFRDGPMARRSAGPVSSAPLLHPRRQRELIEQAAGMTTRQVAGLLADAAPQVVPPRDTLRAVGPDRVTLKVSIDRQCEQGLRQLKGLLSHVDPRMSWGDLVVRLVREALARHDPGGGGRRRQHAGSTAASSRRKRTRTPSSVPAPAPAGGGGDDTPAPQGDTAAGREQPGSATSPDVGPVRSSAPAATAAGAVVPGIRSGGAASAMPAGAAVPDVESHPTKSAPEPASATPTAAPAPEGTGAGTEAPYPAPRAAASGAPRLTVPVAPVNAARQAGPLAAPEAAAPQFTGGSPADCAHVSPAPPALPAPAPQFTSGAAADGIDATPIPRDAPPAPKFATAGPADGTDAAPVSGGAPPAPQSARGGSADITDAAAVSRGAPPARQFTGGGPPRHGAGGALAGASQQCTRDALRGPRRLQVRRPIPAAVRRRVWLRDGGRCRYRDPVTGRRCNSSHLLQIHHLLPVAEGGGPEPHNLALACHAHHSMCHGYGPGPVAEMWR